MAALGIGHRVETLAYEVAEGYEIATAALVGQNLGARRPRRSVASVVAAACQCSLALVPFGVLVATLASPITRFFTSDPVVHVAAAKYLVVNGGLVVFMAFELIADGAFTGWGYPLPAMWAGLVGNAARLPRAAALLQVQGLGVEAVWLAVGLSTVFKGTLKLAWFFRLARRTLWLKVRAF